MLDSASGRIRTLSIRTSEKDSPALRMGIVRSVKAVDFRPAGMAPSAILCVRKLVGRLPGEAVLGAVRRGKAPWQADLKDQLEQAYRSAERPATGRASAHARAVLFRDEGELLACLCRDALDGTLAGKWWWKQNHGPLFNSLPRSAAIRNALSKAPLQLPAVFEQLADWKLAVPLAELLDDNDADALSRALLAEFSCLRLLEKLDAAAGSIKEVSETGATPEAAAWPHHVFHPWFADASDRRFWRERNVHGLIRRDAKTAGIPGRSIDPPWLPLFSDQIWEHRLSRSQACLLGLARTAFTRPALLRNTAFENQVAAWWSVAESTVGLESPGEDTAGFQAESADFDHTPAAQAGGSIHMEPRPARDESSSIDSGLDEVERHHFGDASYYSGASPRRDDSVSHSRDIPTEVFTDPGAPRSQNGETPPSRAPETEAGPAHSYADPGEGAGGTSDPYGHPGVRIHRKVIDEHDPDEASDTGLDDSGPNWLTDNYVDTELGGLLYIINLLEQLELPETMDADWHFDARLGRWGFLELVARGLLNESLEQPKGDPLWCLLAKLSGRMPGSLIGENYPSGFAPDYRLPLDWWEYLKSSVDDPVSLRWAVQADRMRVWCDVCILIERGMDSDCPPDPDGSVALLLDLLRPYQEEGEPLTISPGQFDRAPWEEPAKALVPAVGEPLRHWLSMALPFIRCFLQGRLLLESATGERLLKALLGLPARIYFTPSHVDMVADVNLTSLDIRRSGLDQDPGWQPEYGRVVLFHFARV